MSFLDVLLIFINSMTISSILRAGIWRSRSETVGCLKALYCVIFVDVVANFLVMMLLHNTFLPPEIHAAVMVALLVPSVCLHWVTVIFNNRLVFPKARYKSAFRSTTNTRANQSRG